MSISPFPSSKIPPPKPVGYQQLATYVSSDASLSIFRRFATLNARNILYMQSELAALEERLLQLDAWADQSFQSGRNSGSGSGFTNIWALPRSWRTMQSLGSKKQVVDLEAGRGSINSGGLSDPEDRASEMWSLQLRVPELLDAYNRALKHQAFLHGLQKPNARSHEALQHLLFDEKGNPALVLPFDAEYASKLEDLVTLAPDKGQEILSRFLEDHFHFLFQTKADKARSSEDSPLAFFSEDRIHRLVRGMAVTLSSILPILSVVVLYFINSNNIRLGLIVLFTVICSASLAFLSKASNSEIIVATATYAAVQVVFVSGNLSSGS